MWADTTTLFVTVQAGPTRAGSLLYRGTLTIDPRDFARQLTTMAVTNAPSLLKRIDTIRNFSLFFAGQLFDTYAGLATAAGAGPRRSEAGRDRRAAVGVPADFGARRS